MNQKIYGHGQNAIDYKINRYTLKCMTVTCAAGVLVWIANILGIFIVNQELMAIGVLTFISVIFLTLILCRFINLHKPWVKYMLIFSMVLAVTILETMLTYHTVLFSVLPLLLAIQYTDKKVIVYTYILTIISVYTGVMGGYYWGLCDANMLALTTERTSYYINRLTGTIELIAVNDNPWYTLPVYYVLPRCAILLLLYPVIQSISDNIMDYTKYALSMKRLSELDEMTGLYNKNKYLQMKEEIYSNLQEVAVIFLDVNNLKIINDTQGHAKGDYVITTVGALISELEDERRRAYRIGGDEFVMVVENPKESETAFILEEWESALKKKNEFFKFPLSIAIGWAQGAGSDIEKIEKKADEMMYQNKKEQHENNHL